MARRGRPPRGSDLEPSLFSLDSSAFVAERLEAREWPEHGRFPVNRASHKVRPVVWSDLVDSPAPLVVAGYSSIDQLVELTADWCARRHDGQLRLLLGAEPHPTSRRDFSSSTAGFTEEVRHYWLEERGISVRLSARLIEAIEAIDGGRLACRYLHGASRLHAKIYVGATAATLGSSNFTRAGLSEQVEVNARFLAGEEARRYGELAAIAENLWSAGEDWSAELRRLLEELLRVVGWQEALARACAELLEGEWAARYLAAGDGAALWPSQVAGIAQALWIASDVGSVLVADATGSGKTRMGAHLVRAVRDRMWATGRVRRDLAVVVCPPAVEPTWKREAIACSLNLATTSHGLLSRASVDGQRPEEQAVASAQILAVDEAHNFLNAASNRTQKVSESGADHVLLFTATPISSGAQDLLALVRLLGADNLDDDALEVLRRLERRRGGELLLSPTELDLLRREIARFTVRRTKTMLNDLVARDEAAYLHPDTGRVCRYPSHTPRTYPTGENAGDEAAAGAIRAAADQLCGVALLERAIAVPAALREEYSDERWLEMRLAAAPGLAEHQVLSALRSSRAALLEHLAGTGAAFERFDLDRRVKTGATGDVLSKLGQLEREGPPELQLECEIPGWLGDGSEWVAACRAESERYRSMLDALGQLSPAREEAKADLLAELLERLERVLAFDRHPITLAAICAQLAARGVEAVVATGGNEATRRRVQRLFAREATGRCVALCSEALNEGLNLQGAAALVHLDLPTTLRVAEQRVGRVDRMDSPHDRIEVWWPLDGRAFATRANELLVRRAEESAQLLGANLVVPDLELRPERAEAGAGAVVDLEEQIRESEAPSTETWDGIRDALEPVRRLVSGDEALVDPERYEEERNATHRVLARVAPLTTAAPFAFFAVAGSLDGAPRWLFLDGPQLAATSDLERICHRLRNELAGDPEPRPLDEPAMALLERALDAAVRRQVELLPRRLRRALEQMRHVVGEWERHARLAGDEETATVYRGVAALAAPRHGGPEVDCHLVAERWLELTAPVRERYRRRQRGRRFVLLSEVTGELARSPLPVTTVSGAFSDLPVAAPLEERVTACILGVPDTSPP